MEYNYSDKDMSIGHGADSMFGGMENKKCKAQQ